jgi:hypothetical protein
VLLAAAACGRIGYLPDQGPDDARVPPGQWLDATGGNAQDTGGGSTTDVTSSADATQDVSSSADAVDDTQSADASQAPDVAVDDADASPADGATPDGEGGPTFFVCDSSACCCAYACKYGTVPVASTCSGASDTAQYGFESGTQGWVLSDQSDALIPGQATTTTTTRFAGTSALQVSLNIAGGQNAYARYQSPPVAPAPGAVVTFHVWVSPGATLWGIQPYVMDKNFVWTGAWTEMSQIVQGCWSTITLTVPNNFHAPAWEIGVDFAVATGSSYTGVAYVDAVQW